MSVEPGSRSVQREHEILGKVEIGRLFSSRLRLSTALQVYEERDARELLDLDLTAAKAWLWHLLIETEKRQFAGATHDQTLRWLTFLARGLQQPRIVEPRRRP